ncbi:hypothetical protein GALMADRAFT_71005, partial [Galerina marginata CBS 339.88]
VLHPSLRTEWFRNMAPKSSEKARQDAVDKAATLFRHVAGTYHEKSPAEVDPIATNSSSGTSTNEGGFLASMLQAHIAEVAPKASETPQEKLADEIQRYLRFEGGVGEVANPLGWWKVHAAAFPTIARMARDYLCIPATSVLVERTFSKSRHICQDLRMSLKAQTVTEALLSKVWIRSGLFDVNEPVRRKRKHGEIS